jgi:hypothetical protein
MAGEFIEDYATGKRVRRTPEEPFRQQFEHILIDDLAGYLYACLASQHFGRLLLNKGVYASVVDHITPEFIETLPLPRLDPEREKQIGEMVVKQEEHRAKATATILEALTDFEGDILTALGLHTFELNVAEEED